MERKGLEPIVSAVFLIVLTLGVATLLIIFVGQYSNIDSSPEYSCFEISLRPPISINSACYNEASEEIEIKLFYFPMSEFDIGNINFIFYSSEIQDSNWECVKGGECIILEKGETQTYYFSASGFEAGDLTKLDSVRIFSNNCVISEVKIGVC
ncbi:MAG: hypothetical protein ABIF88_03720 [archaeon]